jgi:hypothetical protein
MKKYRYPEAVREAIHLEYNRKAPEVVRLRVKHLMQLPLVKPWQFIGSAALLLACPLSFYLLGNRLVYSTNVLLILNISAGVAAFMVIFAGVAHRYADPKNKAELLDRLHTLRARI